MAFVGNYVGTGIFLGNITYIKYIFHVKIQFCVTAKYDQDPDPHWFGPLDPDPHRNPCGSDRKFRNTAQRYI